VPARFKYRRYLVGVCLVRYKVSKQSSALGGVCERRKSVRRAAACAEVATNGPNKATGWSLLTSISVDRRIFRLRQLFCFPPPEHGESFDAAACDHLQSAARRPPPKIKVTLIICRARGIFTSNEAARRSHAHRQRVSHFETLERRRTF
jgi:hypothetical protein